MHIFINRFLFVCAVLSINSPDWLFPIFYNKIICALYTREKRRLTNKVSRIWVDFMMRASINKEDRLMNNLWRVETCVYEICVRVCWRLWLNTRRVFSYFFIYLFFYLFFRNYKHLRSNLKEKGFVFTF